MNKLIESLESGLIGFTTFGDGTSFQITSSSETPDDFVFIAPAKMAVLLNQIADDASKIGQVPLLPIKEGGKASLDGKKPASYKLLARLFHINDDKGNPTGKVAFVSIKGPKGYDNLKKVPKEDIKKLKVIFDLGDLTGETYSSPLEWFTTLSLRAPLLKRRQSYVNFGSKAAVIELVGDENDLMA